MLVPRFGSVFAFHTGRVSLDFLQIVSPNAEDHWQGPQVPVQHESLYTMSTRQRLWLHPVIDQISQDVHWGPGQPVWMVPPAVYSLGPQSGSHPKVGQDLHLQSYIGIDIIRQ